MMKKTVFDFATGEQHDVPLSPEEIAAAEAWMQDVEPGKVLERFRDKRNLLLAETDWWASSDRTMTAEQTAYRQALRDLPANTTDPENPVWPTKP